MASTGRTANTQRKRVIRKELQTCSLVGRRAEGYDTLALCVGYDGKMDDHCQRATRWITVLLGSLSAMDCRQIPTHRRPLNVFVRTASSFEDLIFGT